jgi:hypothetical protein
MDETPPMPTSQAEWETHWAFYRLTVMQRDAAWREVEAIRPRIDSAPWPGPYYRLCTSRDTCPCAYAYWNFDPPVTHYHFLGSPTSPGETNEQKG